MVRINIMSFTDVLVNGPIPTNLTYQRFIR